MVSDAGLVLHRIERAASTQAVARELVEHGDATDGHVIVANEQTAGRGRRGRHWLSPRGGLYATFVVSHDRLIAVRAGVASARAMEALSIPVRLKWPNDLVVAEKKLGGILIEAMDTLALVGIGINIGWSPLPEAASLRDFGASAEREELVAAIYAGLVGAAAPGAILAEYRHLSATLERDVRVELGRGRFIRGRAVDVDADGCLVVQTASGCVTVSAGDCVHLSGS